MGLRFKTQLILFLFSSLVCFIAILGYQAWKELEDVDESYYYNDIFEYIAESSADAILGLQQDMIFFVLYKINEDGLYVYDVQDKQMKKFTEDTVRHNLQYELEQYAEELKRDFNGVLFSSTRLQNENMLVGQESAISNLNNVVSDYLDKKENNYFLSLSVKEIIAYYKQLTNEIIKFNEDIKMFPKDNQTKLFMDIDIKLMQLNYNTGLVYGSGAYLAYYKKYDKEMYDDFINSYKNFHIYSEYFVELYSTNASNYYVSSKLKEITERSFLNYFNEYIVEQYKDGNSPKEDEYFRLLHEYANLRYAYFNALSDIGKYTNYSVDYEEPKSTEDDSHFISLISFISYHLNVITTWAIIVYFIFIVVVNILFVINSRNLKNIKEYLIDTFYANKDLSLDVSVVLDDNIGNIGKVIISISSLIKSIMCTQEVQNKKP